MIVFSKTKIYDLSKLGKIYIGRHKNNAITYSENFISKNHGEFFIQNAGMIYKDNSRNGSYLSIGSEKIELYSNSLELNSPGKIYIGDKRGPVISFVPYYSVDTAGIYLIKNKIYDIAHDYYEAIINTKNNFSPDNFKFSALCAYNTGLMEIAVLRMEQYRILRPDDHDAKINLAKIYSDSGNFKKALEIYNIIKIDSYDLYQKHEKTIKELEKFRPSGMEDPDILLTNQIIPQNSSINVKMDNFYIKGELNIHGRIITDVAKCLLIAQENIGKIFGFYPKSTLNVLLIPPSGNRKGIYNGDSIKLALDSYKLWEKPYIEVVVRHEYTHYVFSQLTKKNKELPWWWHEGFAQLFSENLTSFKKKALQEMISKIENKNKILSIMEDYPVVQQPGQGMLDSYYNISHGAAEIILNKIGYTGIKKIVEDYIKTEDMNISLKKYGLSYSSIIQELSSF